MGYEHKAPEQTSGAQRAPVEQPQMATMGLDGGMENAAMQDQLNLGEKCNAAGFEAEGMSPEAGEAMAQMLDWVDQLWLRRMTGVDTVWRQVGEAGVPDWLVDVVGGAVIASVMACTAEITGPMILMIADAQSISKETTKVIQKGLETFATGNINPSVSGAIKGTLSRDKDEDEPDSYAYFNSMKNGLGEERVHAKMEYRKFGTALAGTKDGVAGIYAVCNALRQAVAAAEPKQSQKALVDWMILLAQVDLDSQNGEHGTDMGKAGSGRGLLDKVMGYDPRGVIIVRALFKSPEDPKEAMQINGVELGGLSPSAFATLKKIKTPISQLGMPIVVAGIVDGTSATIEIKQNERGVRTNTSNEDGQEWLDHYSSSRDVDNPVNAVFMNLTAMPLADLNVTLS